MEKQKVIKITKENRDEVKKYCLKNGKDECSAAFTIGYYYGIDSTGCISAHISVNSLEVVSNVSDLEEKSEKTFPRMMMVGDYKENLKPKMALSEDKSGRSKYPFLAVSESQYNKFDYVPSFYRFAEEMPEPRKITRGQVKEWAGGEFEIID